MESKETPGEKFFNILKKTGYKGCEKLSAKNFEYLFSIPDTSAFFNWFINNVDENCLLTKEELEKFKQKMANNQVIYDLERLEGLNSIINPNILQRSDKLNLCSRNFLDKLFEKLTNEECDEKYLENDVEAMKREIEFQERELQTINKQIEFQSFQKKRLGEKLMDQKAKRSTNENLKDETSIDFENVKKSSKQSLQCLNKNLLEFQILFGEEEKLSKENNLFNINEEETNLKAYMCEERDLLKAAQEIMHNEVDMENLLNFPSNNESEEKLRDELYLFNKCFPKLILKYINSKIEMEIQKEFYNTMEKIYENPGDFFLFNFKESQPCTEMTTSERKLLVLTNEQCEVIKKNIAKFDDSIEKINASCRSYSDCLNEKSNKYSRLRIMNLFLRNVVKKEVNLRLTLIKQDKILRVMHNQKTRIEFLKQFQHSKLNKIENLKVSFEEMIAGGNALFSLLNNMSKQKSLSQTQLTSLSTSNLTGNFLSSTVINSNQNNNNNNNTLTNSSIYLGSPQNRLREKSYLVPYKPVSCSFTDFNIAEESIHVNLLNQVLIQILKHFQNDFDHLITLKKPVSIDFNDNMLNFTNLIKSIDSLCEEKRKKWLLQIKAVDGLLDLSIEYLYDKVEQSNKINMKIPSYLDEMLKKCSEKSNEIKSLYVEKIFKPYNNYTQQLEQNKLIQLKRKFFIHFYNYDGDKINHIMDQLNGMMGER